MYRGFGGVNRLCVKRCYLGQLGVNEESIPYFSH